jgi:hypothetical protein
MRVGPYSRTALTTQQADSRYHQNHKRRGRGCFCWSYSCSHHDWVCRYSAGNSTYFYTQPPGFGPHTSIVYDTDYKKIPPEFLIFFFRFCNKTVIETIRVCVTGGISVIAVICVQSLDTKNQTRYNCALLTPVNPRDPKGGGGTDTPSLFRQ